MKGDPCVCGCGLPVSRKSKTITRPGHYRRVPALRDRVNDKSHNLLPTAPLVKLLDKLRDERGIPWMTVAKMSGEAYTYGTPWLCPNFYRIRNRQWMYRHRAERILRAIAQLPREPSAMERKTPGKMAEAHHRW
jgi:hypothetical protein